MPLPHVPVRLQLNPESVTVSHAVDLQLNPETGSLRATDEITVARVPASARLRFRFMKTLHIDAIEADGQPVRYSFSGGTLAVSPAPARFIVRYHGVVAHEHHTTALLDEDWWLPSTLGLQLACTLHVTVPPGQQVAASGDPDGPCRWAFDNRHPGMALIAGHFIVHPYRMDNLPITVYLPPGSTVHPRAVASRASAAVRYFASLWGAYPYSKLDIIEGGSGTSADTEASWIRMAPAVLHSDSMLDDYMPHEVSHNWWSNAVIGYSSDSLWFEAAAEESAELYRHAHGQTAGLRKTRLDALSDWTRKYGPRGSVPIADELTYDGDEVNDVAYNKGWFLLSQLCDLLGEDTFNQAWRRFVDEQTGRLPGWGDMRATFERLSGQNLGWFFDQWLNRPDAASLSLAAVRYRREGSGYAVTGQLIQHTRPYRLLVPIRIDGTTIRMTTDRTVTPFHAHVSKRPAVVELDPDFRLFRLLRRDTTAHL